ncbi:two-component regulator propeller domain-containing protein [Bacteroides propionicifaciens]|uniref:two-component regulator propeller domain-containing protein n=1 Tax=Bacteroides propionicifaciens TaxID=392838 RepID=UPI00046ACAF7|nr:two-component regulator propeller domain-containing protein [Bacteroides propionicifaciens]
MKRLTYILCLLCFSFISQAQTYTYLNIKDGLSHRHVYSISKDNKGYMWFLTQKGADRYNGSAFKHYNFTVDHKILNTSAHLKSLYFTADSLLFQVGSDGKVFRFNEQSDQFDYIYSYPNETNEILLLSFNYIDSDNKIWMGSKGNLHIYDSKKDKEVTITQHPLYAATAITEMRPNTFAIGTTNGIYGATITGDTLRLNNTTPLLNNLEKQIEKLYYHEATHSLIISTLRKGLYIYKIDEGKLSEPFDLKTASVNEITTFSDSEVLVATNGAGVFKIDLENNTWEPFIVANYDEVGEMNGNNIKDILIDDENRIWMANYPNGVTIRTDRNNLDFDVIQHIPKKNTGLIHNQVNDFVEDKDGDIWFATNNGISVYFPKQDRWESYLSSYDNDKDINNHMFLTINEVRPGIVWAGGYSSGLYEINKSTKRHKLLLSNEKEQISEPDKCIRAILKGTNQSIWVGGYYNLRQIDPEKMQIRYFNNISAITSLEEMNESNLWIGTSKGLFLLDKTNGNSRHINLPTSNPSVNVLYQNKDGVLYIGTNDGLFLFNSVTNTFKHFHTQNSSLLSNSIQSIVPDKDQPRVYLATDSELSLYEEDTERIYNWTKDQGMLDTFFNTNSGIQLSNGEILFGSADGVILFDQECIFPTEYKSKLVFEELEVNQRSVYPSQKQSILTQLIDKTNKITLGFRDNNIALEIGSINFDNPSNILYSWQMEGLNDEWSEPSPNTRLVFSNLSPGTYFLKVRTILSGSLNQTLEERTLQINVKQPFWWSAAAKVIYVVGFIILLLLLIRYLIKRSERKLVDHTKQFYYNTAHDIRVPLQLIQEPLMELKEKEDLTTEGMSNIRIVLRNLNILLTQNDTTINFERMEKNKNRLYLSEHNLPSFIENIVKLTIPVAEIKQIDINFNNTITGQFKIWMDNEKIRTILSNLLNQIIECSDDFKSINIIIGVIQNEWFLEITYEGKPLPIETIQDSTNGKFIDDAIQKNTTITDNLGLQLIGQLLKLYQGSIQFKNVDKKSYYIRLNLPIYHQAITDAELVSQFHKKETSTPDTNKTSPLNVNPSLNSISTVNGTGTDKLLILLVESDPDIIEQMNNNFSDTYEIINTPKGQEAISIAKRLRPSIIISRMNLEDIKGTELSATLKSEFETSHIPIILMTDSNEEKHIIKGLQNGADEFILKPFNYRILKASIANLLSNRALLRDRYASLEIQESIDCEHCTTNLEWKFIATIKESVEKHMSEPDFTVDKLCAILNMSRTSFYNKLKDLTNKTPSDYIRIIKLNYAAKLLLEKEFTISEIADKTGFNDAKYFREVFKKHYNMTPSKYAKEKQR